MIDFSWFTQGKVSKIICSVVIKVRQNCIIVHLHAALLFTRMYIKSDEPFSKVILFYRQIKCNNILREFFSDFNNSSV